MSLQSVSGFSRMGVDLQIGPGNFPGSPGNFRGSLGSLRGTSGLSIVREVPGKSPRNFWVTHRAGESEL